MSNRSRDSLHLGAQLATEWQRSGITFRIMLVGESGLGKSTFTRALLRPFVPEHILDDSSPPPPRDAPAYGCICDDAFGFHRRKSDSC